MEARPTPTFMAALTLLAGLVIGAFYSEPATHSYCVGCSTSLDVVHPPQMRP